MRLLLVEDEAEMASALSAALLKYDMVIDHAPNLAFAEEAIPNRVHAAFLLDRNLPDGDGIDLIPFIRQQVPGAPIIVLTARGSLVDRITGLDQGADDYLPKPFAVEELLARLRAVMRRPAQIAVNVGRVGNLTYDFANRHVSIQDNPVDLPRRELLVLETLVQRTGRTVLRTSLEEAVYGFDDEIQSNALDAHVSRLRRKLADAGATVEIHTIRGVGYLMKQAR
ncbi:response regulator [Devosia sp. D6-9]|nr:response regulator [Devosia sp. D6-9]